MVMAGQPILADYFAGVAKCGLTIYAARCVAAHSYCQLLPPPVFHGSTRVEIEPKKRLGGKRRIYGTGTGSHGEQRRWQHNGSA